MVDKVAEFFDMGGYAAYVWPSYALTAIVLLALLVMTWRFAKSNERQLALLQSARAARRENRGDKDKGDETVTAMASPPEVTHG